jgi:hypothetical protein
MNGFVDRHLQQALRALGEELGDVAATAMIDRLVHHAEVIALKNSHRIKDGPRPRPQRHG